MWLEWYLMLLLLLFTVAAPPQFMRPYYYDSDYDDLETEKGKTKSTNKQK